MYIMCHGRLSKSLTERVARDSDINYMSGKKQSHFLIYCWLFINVLQFKMLIFTFIFNPYIRNQYFLQNTCYPIDYKLFFVINKRHNHQISCQFFTLIKEWYTEEKNNLLVNILQLFLTSNILVYY